jgi:ferritin-like metal-binding protein YciE
MEGLLEEGKEVLEEDGEPAVIDAALIASAQRVEHYEIAAYGCLRTYAQLLGYSQAEQLLQQTLEEEEAADKKLTELGESGINEAAAAVGGGQAQR